MLTLFGKQLRMLRIEKGELLKDMALNLQISPSYLSSLENGKREPTVELTRRIIMVYNLSEEAAELLEDARAKTLGRITIESKDSDAEDLGLLFARRFGELSLDEIRQITNILNRT